ncbi:hypothetical protein BRO05_02145, partial [Xanthomonas oryzae pv. oryzae]
SATAQQARLAVWDGVLKQLDGIDPKQLSPANQINLAIYHPQVENLAADVRTRLYEMPFNVFNAANNQLRGVLRSSTNHQPTVWCSVLANCGTVGGMDAAIERHGRVHGVSRERRGHRAFGCSASMTSAIQVIHNSRMRLCNDCRPDTLRPCCSAAPVDRPRVAP